ncbi:MAG: class I SAM-dependent methyltransferase [Acidimicrobiia bacterium]
MDPSDPAYKGQSEYTPFMLGIYDRFVIGFMAGAVLRCPIPPLLDQYERFVGRRHLDVGPGTGYFLDRSNIADDTEVTLLDPNPNVLAHSSRVLERMQPRTVEADVLKPLPLSDRFDSAALNMVMHCLPGPQTDKARAVRNVAAVLEPEGVLFGATVLGRSGRHTPPARAFLAIANRAGGFDNLGDSVEGLVEILTGSFEDVSIEEVGSAARFVARRPRRQDEK